MRSKAEEWTEERLWKALGCTVVSDSAIEKALPLLNEPDESLPPLNADSILLEVGDESASNWADEKRAGYRRYAGELLREGIKEARLQKRAWEQALDALDDLGGAVLEAEDAITKQTRRCCDWIDGQIPEGARYADVFEELREAAAAGELEERSHAMALLTELHRKGELEKQNAEIQLLKRKLTRLGYKYEFKLGVLSETLRHYVDQGEDGLPPTTEQEDKECPHHPQTCEYLRAAYQWLAAENRPEGNTPTELWRHIHRKTGKSLGTIRRTFKNHGWYDPNLPYDQGTPTEHTVRQVLAEGKKYFG